MSDFFAPTRDFIIEVQKGRVPGHRIVTSRGHNQVVGTVAEDIWNQGGIYSWLDVDTVMTLSSSSADDTALGTGARTVRLYGLDADFNEINEVITLNGQTPVSTVNSYLRVYDMIVLTADSSNQAYNIGDIYVGTGTVTAGVPAVVHLHMVAAENRTQACRYTIPAGHTAYMLEHHFSVVGNNVAAECFIFSRVFGQVFTIRRRLMVVENNHIFRGYAVLPEKSDIVARAYVSQGSTDIASFFALLLVKNDP